MSRLGIVLPLLICFILILLLPTLPGAWWLALLPWIFIYALIKRFNSKNFTRSTTMLLGGLGLVRSVALLAWMTGLHQEALPNGIGAAIQAAVLIVSCELGVGLLSGLTLRSCLQARAPFPVSWLFARLIFEFFPLRLAVLRTHWVIALDERLAATIWHLGDIGVFLVVEAIIVLTGSALHQPKDRYIRLGTAALILFSAAVPSIYFGELPRLRRPAAGQVALVGFSRPSNALPPPPSTGLQRMAQAVFNLPNSPTLTLFSESEFLLEVAEEIQKKAQSQKRPLLTIWPESTLTLNQPIRIGAQAELPDTLTKLGPQLIGVNWSEEHSTRNAALYFDQEGRLRHQYLKRFELPFLETRLTGEWMSKSIKLFRYMLRTSYDSEPLTVISVNESLRIIPLICYDALVPDTIDQLRRAGLNHTSQSPLIVTVLANHTAIENTGGVFYFELLLRWTAAVSGLPIFLSVERGQPLSIIPGQPVSRISTFSTSVDGTTIFSDIPVSTSPVTLEKKRFKAGDPTSDH